MGQVTPTPGAVALLAGVALLALLLYFLLGRWVAGRRRALGIDAGRLLVADDTRLGGGPAPTLRSARLGLAGRCDHLLRVGRACVPVEQKPSARRLAPSHVLQVGAQCLLLHDVTGVRPPYGVVVLAGGQQERVPYTPALEGQVRGAMAAMRGYLDRGEAPGARWVPPRCRACAFHALCWEGA